jgi:hypothetical protein
MSLWRTAADVQKGKLDSRQSIWFCSIHGRLISVICRARQGARFVYGLEAFRPKNAAVHYRFMSNDKRDAIASSDRTAQSAVKTVAQATNETVVLNVDSTFGNFDYVLTAAVPVSCLIEAGRKGLVWEVQRSPAGKAEAVLTGYDGKTKVKPETFTRTDIPFTKENAAILARELGKRSNFAKGSFLPENVKIDVKVTEHISTVTESKWSKAKAFIDGKLAMGEDLTPIAKRVNYAGKGKLNSENPEFLELVGKFMAQARP